MSGYRKILLIFVFLFTFAVVSSNFSSNRASAAQMNKQYRQANASWQGISGAKKYNFYYKEKGAKKYQHAVGDLPSTSVRVTIGGLKTDTAYVYNVAAVNPEGREFWWSGEKPL